jgi:GNAT superfamily N-acetyltransferase
MNIEIRTLSPDLLDDFLNYFDNIAFADHQEWSGCYCTHFHWDSALEEEHQRLRQTGITKTGRDYAIEFINSGVIQGYLAYSDNHVIGWCNANNKSGFKNLVERKELWDNAEINEKIKSVVCFTIAPDMRGKGIATQLLNRVCQDAICEGYSAIEAYPHQGETNVFMNHYGPFALYEKCGFRLYKNFKYDCIVRKNI